jgi:hypothetical protein
LGVLEESVEMHGAMAFQNIGDISRKPEDRKDIPGCSQDSTSTPRILTDTCASRQDIPEPSPDTKVTVDIFGGRSEIPRSSQYTTGTQRKSHDKFSNGKDIKESNQVKILQEYKKNLLIQLGRQKTALN